MNKDQRTATFYSLFCSPIFPALFSFSSPKKPGTPTPPYPVEIFL